MTNCHPLSPLHTGGQSMIRFLKSLLDGIGGTGAWPVLAPTPYAAVWWAGL
jgi:hypothetical protein